MIGFNYRDPRIVVGEHLPANLRIRVKGIFNPSIGAIDPTVSKAKGLKKVVAFSVICKTNQTSSSGLTIKGHALLRRALVKMKDLSELGAEKQLSVVSNY